MKLTKTEKQRKRKYTEEVLLSRLQDACDVVGRSVGGEEIDRMKGFPGRERYRLKFGSFTNALKAIGREPFWSPCRRGQKNDGREAEKSTPGSYRIFSRALKTRFAIFSRDNFTCQYCGRTPQMGAVLMIDHVVPVSKGGADGDLENLVAACFECNIGKSDIMIEANDLKKK